MSTFGSLTSAGDVGASALRTAAELADEAVSANTRRTYENAWRVWATWCSDHGASGLCDRPADREPYVAALILFLSERVNAGVRPPSTAGQVVHAIRYAARRANSVETLAALSHPPQLQVRLRGLARRDAQTARKQAEPPLTLDLLGSLYRQAASERTARGIRDAALIATGIGAALRASSIGNLQVGGDVAQAQTIDGLVLHLRTSKTDQTGRGSYIPIKRAIDDASRHLDPVTKLLAWRRHLTAAGASSTARCSRGSAETTASRATGSRTRTRRSRTCSGTGSDASASTTRSPQASPRTASEQPSSRSPQPPGPASSTSQRSPATPPCNRRRLPAGRGRTSRSDGVPHRRPPGVASAGGALQSRRDAPNLAAPNNASPKVGIPSTTRSARA